MVPLVASVVKAFIASFILASFSVSLASFVANKILAVTSSILTKNEATIAGAFNSSSLDLAQKPSVK